MQYNLYYVYENICLQNFVCNDELVISIFMERTGTGFDVVKLLHDVEPFFKVKKFKEEQNFRGDLPKTKRLCVKIKMHFLKNMFIT